jgi:NAD(P)-dependent dehydrogenase (short-subunit alcohol dehydrogenase family)
LERRYGTVAVIGAADPIGAAIAKRFAVEGFTIFAGARSAAKLAPLVRHIEALDGRIFAHALDAGKEQEISAFLAAAEQEAPLEVCIFNVGSTANCHLVETTDRVFRKVWEAVCYAGFLTSREAARLMVPRRRGAIFFTGTTASLHGGIGHAAVAAARFGLRAVTQSAARELGPKNIHVAHLVIDLGIDTAPAAVRITRHRSEKVEKASTLSGRMRPDAVAESYWQLYDQSRDAWSSELEIRPSGDEW